MRTALVAALSALSFLTGCDEGVRSASDEASPTPRACAGLPDAVIDRGVADMRSNVDAAGPLRDGEGRKTLATLVGGVVQIHAAPGMTAQWLGRMLQCDTARHAAAALVPAGAGFEVTPTPTGFSVSVRSSDPDLAREIERRAIFFAHPVQASGNTRD
jgi:hypothetical protein